MPGGWLLGTELVWADTIGSVEQIDLPVVTLGSNLGFLLILVEVDLIIAICISSTMMTIPLTARVTGSGSKDRDMGLSVRKVSSSAATSL